MYRYKYPLADLFFEVQADSAFTYVHDDKFRKYGNILSAENDIVHVSCEIDPAINSYFPSNVGFSAIQSEKKDNRYYIYLRDDNGSIAHIIKADSQLKNFIITTSAVQKMPFDGSAGEVLFRTSLLFHNGIVLHSAAIDYNGNGILFSAPSGTGKSTQANLWRETKGAVVLNGDRPALRLVDGTVYVYGTMWSGTSPDSKNAKAPLKAIIMLEQAENNSIIQLSPQEAVQYLMPRCYLPYGAEDLLEKAIDNLDAILKKVPVYLLKCRPDYEAVELTCKCLNM